MSRRLTDEELDRIINNTSDAKANLYVTEHGIVIETEREVTVIPESMFKELHKWLTAAINVES